MSTLEIIGLIIAGIAVLYVAIRYELFGFILDIIFALCGSSSSSSSSSDSSSSDGFGGGSSGGGGSSDDF